jgi:hypothetical protein
VTCEIDAGVAEDFDNMTKEVGRLVTVQSRTQVLGYEGHEGESTTYTSGTQEYAVLQQLNSEHEVVASGEFKVGDFEATMLSTSVVEEEGRIIADNVIYKVLRVDRINSLGSDAVLYVVAYGKKISRR